jgi:hypothetical protein
MRACTSNAVEIFPPDSNPYGLTYGEWSAKWWQWILAIPPDRNPLLDKTGQYCNEGQTDQNVFFLGGTFGGKVERTCTIPSDKAIFFPIINYEGNFIEDKTIHNEPQLVELVKSQIDDIKYFYVTFDGMELQKLENFRSRKIFTLTFPENNVFGVKNESTLAVADGYYIMIKPLLPGIHHLTFGGSCLAGKINIGISYQLKIGK